MKRKDATGGKVIRENKAERERIECALAKAVAVGGRRGRIVQGEERQRHRKRERREQER